MATILPKFQAKSPYSQEVPGQKPVEGETPIRRIPAAIPELVAKPAPNISTLYELVRDSVEKYGYAFLNRGPFLGRRRNGRRLTLTLP